MAQKLRILVALIVIAGVTFWAVNSLRTLTYAGSAIKFSVGNGHVVVNNLGAEPIQADMRTDTKSGAFRVESTDLNLRASSKRVGSGRSAFNVVAFQLPPGESRIDVTRGSNVYFNSPSSQAISAQVVVKGQESRQTILGFTIIVILGALFYISRTVNHRWVAALRNKLPGRSPKLKGTAA